MNGAEFKTIRESLGLSTGWLANHWGLESERAIRRWEDGDAPVPERRGLELASLEVSAEQSADDMISSALGQIGLDDIDDVEDLDKSAWPTVEVPRVDADCAETGLPASFWRAIAFRVRWEFGGHVWFKFYGE
ncbi:hypothetical protein [Propionimicrobium sp. PCR01-08-3]|uniref:hypothetical protein n=1 Tax=Propionimicrobium sp. PCR01-08-3 TaxID=3052086 RepID=UPI00255C3831|nr:hypothetical protein [Propionimicrobium sp. PCR01-08-3]WIY84345.1 hypothetical protein QQ658_15145 [Propionimicrobium sp. PCR01-08-3]